MTNAADHRVDAPFATDGQLRSEMVRLRSRLGTQPTIGRALGILQERYRLHDRDLAFDLLKTSSQRHNVRLHVLADAFVAAPRPSSTSEFWFPGRLRRAAPPLSFAPHQVARGTNRTAVLDALLDATLDCTETTTGGVRLIDLTSGDLHLERHRGLPVEFLHFFATRQEPPVGSRLALHRRAHVVIADVATDPILADHTERAAILATGIRSTQSSPLLTASRLLGVVSTYHPLPDHAPTTGQRQRLEAITTQGAAWLEWYRRTVVLDALEHVHQSARAARNTR